MYKQHVGHFYNISNLANSLTNQNNYGANSVVNYIGFGYRGISHLDSIFEVINIKPNDFILYHASVDNLEHINLLNFTPYFYKYQEVEVFASVDKTIDTFTRKDLKICCTCSIPVAQYYSRQGYTISYIPKEYIADAKYMTLIRVGATNPSSSEILTEENGEMKISRKILNFESTYYEYTGSKVWNSDNYATMPFIVNRFPEVLAPKITLETIPYILHYSEIKNYFMSMNLEEISTYPYLSNLYNTNYAMKSFYNAITVNPFAQVQANNTQENYFNSDILTLDDPSKVIYIFSLNQKKMLACLTSNVQVYDMSNRKSILTYDTSPLLPAMSSPHYPRSCGEDSVPVYNLNMIRVSDLLEQGINSIMIVERLGYNPVNFNYTQYDKIFNCVAFYGDEVEDISSILPS